MKYGYVAKLAGFEPTPAEEMRAEEGKTKTEHWCKEHNTAFFKKGKMKAYAHPIEGSDQWCYEHKDKSTDKPKANPQAAKTTGDPAPAGKVEEILQYIADQMKFGNIKTARQWLEKSMEIDKERIDSDPEGVLKEVADLKGWNLK